MTERIEELAEALIAGGWTTIKDEGFLDLVGPIWESQSGDEFAIIGQSKHRNQNGFVQGGLLVTFADRSMGIVARAKADVKSLTTIQLDTQFIDAAKIGEVLLSKPRVIRVTKLLIFMNTEVMAGGRCIISANAVFKVRKAD